MGNLVVREVFPRTDFGSFGWIAKVPLALPEIPDLFVASQSQSKSFRVPERSDQLDLYGQTWTRLDWIAKVPESLVEVPKFVPAWLSLVQSFRKPERSDQLPLWNQTWQRLDWIDKIAGSLPEPPPTPTTEFTISRNRFKLNLQGQHIGLKFQHDTLDEGVQLEDVGIGIGLFPRAWQNQHNMNLNGNHITLKFVHNVLDEIVYLQDVGFNIFTHGWR